MIPRMMNPNPFYLTIEIQESDTGTRSCLPYFFDDYDRAVSKFGQILEAAAVSSIPYHGVMIIDNTGACSPGDCRVFDRRDING